MNKLLSILALCLWLSQAVADALFVSPAVQAPQPPSGDSFDYTGIPYPTFTTPELEALGYTPFPYDPTQIQPPDRPAPWNTNVPGFYYVSASGTNLNNNGYPANPTDEIPDDPPAGSLIVISAAGGTYSGNYNRTFNGTASDPIWLVSDVATKPVFDIPFQVWQGTHFIIDNLHFRTTDKTAVDVNNSDFVTLRNVKVESLATSSFGSVVGTSTGMNNLLVYQSEIVGPEATWPQTNEDVHGFKLYGKSIWIIENNIHHHMGDCLQQGDANDASDTDIERVFLAGNTIHHCYQTGYWIKNGQDSIASGNTFYSNDPSGGGSTAAGTGGQYDWEWGWWLNNEVYDNGGGVVIKSVNEGPPATPIYVIGNLIRDGTGAEYTPGNASSNAAFGSTNDQLSQMYILLNTVSGYVAGVHNVRSEVYVYGNFLDDPTDPGGEHILTDGTVTADYNFYRGTSFRSSGTILANTNSQVGTNPQFENELADNFIPAAGSPLLDELSDVTGVVVDAFNAFEARYGFSIREDFRGKPRPVNALHDIGAYERQADD